MASPNILFRFGGVWLTRRSVPAVGRSLTSSATVVLESAACICRPRARGCRVASVVALPVSAEQCGSNRPRFRSPVAGRRTGHTHRTRCALSVIRPFAAWNFKRVASIPRAPSRRLAICAHSHVRHTAAPRAPSALRAHVTGQRNAERGSRGVARLQGGASSFPLSRLATEQLLDQCCMRSRITDRHDGVLRT